MRRTRRPWKMTRSRRPPATPVTKSTAMTRVTTRGRRRARAAAAGEAARGWRGGDEARGPGGELAGGGARRVAVAAVGAASGRRRRVRRRPASAAGCRVRRLSARRPRPRATAGPARRRGLAGEPGAPAASHGASDAGGGAPGGWRRGPGPRRIMTPVDAALEILRGQAPGRGVHVRQIADGATRRRLVHGEPNEAWRVMRTALAAEPRERLRAGLRPRVRSAGAGLYALARRPPDPELERAEQVFGEARRALRERTVAGARTAHRGAAGVGVRGARPRAAAAGGLRTGDLREARRRHNLRRGAARARAAFVALPGRLRSAAARRGRRAIGELRAGIRARRQDEGLLMLAGRLAEDAIAEWKQPGRRSRSRTGRRWPRPASATASASSTRWSASTSSTPTSSPTSPRGDRQPPRQPAGWRWLGRVPFAAAAREQERLRDAGHPRRRPRDAAAVRARSGRHPGPVGEAGARAGVGGRARAPRRRCPRRIAWRRRHLSRARPAGRLPDRAPARRRGRSPDGDGARAVARVLAELGIDARWRREAPGLWVAVRGAHAKICAFGVHVRRRVAMHGFALNVAGRAATASTDRALWLGGVATTSIAASIATGDRSRAACTCSASRVAGDARSLAARVSRALSDHELDIEFVPEIEIRNGSLE